MSRRTRATERETSPTEVTRTTVMEVTAEIQSQNPKRETETRAAIARRAETTDPAMVTVVRTATTRATAPIPDSTVWTATTPDPSNDRRAATSRHHRTGRPPIPVLTPVMAVRTTTRANATRSRMGRPMTVTKTKPPSRSFPASNARRSARRGHRTSRRRPPRERRARPRAPRERGRARHRARTTEALASGPNPRPARANRRRRVGAIGRVPRRVAGRRAGPPAVRPHRRDVGDDRLCRRRQRVDAARDANCERRRPRAPARQLPTPRSGFLRRLRRRGRRRLAPANRQRLAGRPPPEGPSLGRSNAASGRSRDLETRPRARRHRASSVVVPLLTGERTSPTGVRPRRHEPRLERSRRATLE